MIRNQEKPKSIEMQETIDRWIKEDVPYITLTTPTLGIGGVKGKISSTAREFTKGDARYRKIQNKGLRCAMRLGRQFWKLLY